MVHQQDSHDGPYAPIPSATIASFEAMPELASGLFRAVVGSGSFDGFGTVSVGGWPSVCGCLPLMALWWW